MKFSKIHMHDANNSCLYRVSGMWGRKDIYFSSISLCGINFFSLNHVGILFFNLKKLENALNIKITYSVYSNISFIVIRNKIFSLTIYLGQGWHDNRVAIWAKKILLRGSERQVKDPQNMQRKKGGVHKPGWENNHFSYSTNFYQI